MIYGEAHGQIHPSIQVQSNDGSDFQDQEESPRLQHDRMLSEVSPQQEETLHQVQARVHHLQVKCCNHVVTNCCHWEKQA